MSYSVIVADDQDLIREHLCKFVSDMESFEVVASFEDGSDVIEYLANNRVDIILTDVLMYQVTGIEVAKYVYENKLKTHVVIISAHKDFEYARSSIVYGVRDYLTKPTSPKELRKTLERLKTELDSEKSAGELVSTKSFGADTDKNASVVQKALDYIAEHYSENISITDVARHVYLNDDYFGRLIKKSLNMSFSDYLMSIRMKEAKRLLKDGRFKIYQVGEKVGYKSTNYFIKVFKNYTGYTPKDYCRNIEVGHEE